jgi:hypothetical protein
VNYSVCENNVWNESFRDQNGTQVLCYTVVYKVHSFPPITNIMICPVNQWNYICVQVFIAHNV